MRPVERGTAPRNYAKYDDALDDLVGRIGHYCSYCERRLPASLAVEHKAPKNLYPHRELEWDNFLLGCTNCNSVKLNKDVDDDALLWPDRDNTQRAFVYEQGGFVTITRGLRADTRSRAENLMALVGLNRHPAIGRPRPAPKDRRWLQREEAWATAEKCRTNYEALGRSPAALELVMDVAKGFGFFSVWLTVFAPYREARLRLIQTFTGTAIQCFDDNGNSVSRPGGVI